ncbi:hypothetical protein KKH15_03315 [Patescibacteria group bacterium]|nr:hypothetical protein [Patescibacteria group bacterium]MBU1755253.1 hypothetical protein [Patescibacteria group bacterium]
MTNAEIIERVKAWQDNPRGHPMSCDIDSEHKPLVPAEDEGSVVLVCPDCGYIQNFVPSAVLGLLPDAD